MRIRQSRNTWLTILVIIGLVIFQYFYPGDTGVTTPDSAGDSSNAVEAAYAAKRSGVWLETEGQVTRILSDDNEGSRKSINPFFRMDYRYRKSMVFELEGGLNWFEEDDGLEVTTFTDYFFYGGYRWDF